MFCICPSLWLFPHHLGCAKIPGLWSEKKVLGRWGGPAEAFAVFSQAGHSPCGTPRPAPAWDPPCSILYWCGSTAPHVEENYFYNLFPSWKFQASFIHLLVHNERILFFKQQLLAGSQTGAASGKWQSFELANFHISPREETIINFSTQEAEV